MSQVTSPTITPSPSPPALSALRQCRACAQAEGEKDWRLCPRARTKGATDGGMTDDTYQMQQPLSPNPPQLPVSLKLSSCFQCHVFWNDHVG